MILGVDPGLDRTGYAVIEMPGRKVLDAGLIRSTETGPLAERLADIDAGLAEVLREHAVDLVAVEDLYAHYKHPRTAILMGHARGVILLAAARRKIDVMSLPATRIKKALTGNGHASKVQMQRAILATLRLSTLPEPADVADALAVALCATHASRPGERTAPVESGRS
ncbi:MAG: crossover junction endodeoxyribonuclease RuvC [Phycisphaerae bacterium]